MANAGLYGKKPGIRAAFNALSMRSFSFSASAIALIEPTLHSHLGIFRLCKVTHAHQMNINSSEET